MNVSVPTPELENKKEVEVLPGCVTLADGSLPPETRSQLLYKKGLLMSFGSVKEAAWALGAAARQRPTANGVAASQLRQR